jgi:hypothetical protein
VSDTSLPHPPPVAAGEGAPELTLRELALGAFLGVVGGTLDGVHA